MSAFYVSVPDGPHNTPRTTTTTSDMLYPLLALN